MCAKHKHWTTHGEKKREKTELTDRNQRRPLSKREKFQLLVRPKNCCSLFTLTAFVSSVIHRTPCVWRNNRICNQWQFELRRTEHLPSAVTKSLHVKMTLIYIIKERYLQLDDGFVYPIIVEFTILAFSMPFSDKRSLCSCRWAEAHVSCKLLRHWQYQSQKTLTVCKTVAAEQESGTPFQM